MNGGIPVVYDKNVAHKVPAIWRDTLFRIVEAFKNNNLNEINGIEGVQKIELVDLQEIASNISDYDETLMSLPEETWETSQSLWLGPCSDVIVDLFTEQAGRSDLILYVKVFEKNKSFEFVIQDIYVP